uniref:Uncharacterized protein n=1 Tax=Ignisphaera aggregans TaxID=334771 RepID=A0A7C4FH57_9CREN
MGVRAVEKVQYVRQCAEEVVEILSILVADGVYGPVDRLARAADIETIYTATYEALRYIIPDLRECQEGKESEEQSARCVALKDILREFKVDESKITCFVNEASPKLAKRVAIEALSRGLSLREKYPQAFSSRAIRTQEKETR